MRGTRAFRGVVLASVIVAAIGSQIRPAFALDPPTTIPTITVPLDGAVLSGDVTVSATSQADTVQFYLGVAPADEDPFGAPVPVVSGVASITWHTYAWENGGLQLLAQDCNADGCNQSRATPVNVTLNNPLPTLTAPVQGAITSSTPTFTADATDAPVVAFYLDGHIVGYDDSAPYSFTVTDPLSEGSHLVSALGCFAEMYCALQSQIVGFTVVNLHPQITSVAPNPFSPNGDRRDDATTVTLSLPDTESVSWSVVNGLGTVEQGPNSLGQLDAGSHSFVWSGLDNSQARVPDGTHQVVLSTTGTVDGVEVSGTATAPVTVDTVAPVLGVPSGANTTFYPVHDGFRDTFAPTVSVNEPGTLWLDIRTTDGRSVRLLKLVHPRAGSFRIAWAGGNTAGHLVPAGTYHFRMIADDLAGNRRTGATYNVTVSLRHLVTKTAAITKHGRAYDFVGGSKSCAGGSAGQSAFKPIGLRLFNLCSPATTEVGLAQYSFGLPAAISYSSLHVDSYGFSPDAPVGVATLIWNFPRDDADVVSGVAVRNRTKAWTSLGGIAASQHVSGGRIVQIAIGLLNVSSPALYDIGFVRLTVTYRVLS